MASNRDRRGSNFWQIPCLPAGRKENSFGKSRFLNFVARGPDPWSVLGTEEKFWSVVGLVFCMFPVKIKPSRDYINLQPVTLDPNVVTVANLKNSYFKRSRSVSGDKSEPPLSQPPRTLRKRRNTSDTIEIFHNHQRNGRRLAMTYQDMSKDNLMKLNSLTLAKVSQLNNEEEEECDGSSSGGEEEGSDGGGQVEINDLDGYEIDGAEDGDDGDGDEDSLNLHPSLGSESWKPQKTLEKPQKIYVI